MPRWPKVWRLLGPALVVVVLATAVGALVRVPYLAIAPGKARPTGSNVEVNGVATYPADGEVLFTTVNIGRTIGIEAVWGWLAGDIDVVPDQVVNGDRSDAESRKANQALMDTSKVVAAQVALEQLGYEVEVTGTGVSVLDVEDGLPVSDQLAAGDVIVGVDGEPVTVTDQLIARVEGSRPGDVIRLEVERSDGETEEVRATLSPRPDNPEAAMIGVTIGTRDLGFDLPFEVSVDTGRVGGPSAGLAITLAVLDRLTPGSITGGTDVAVTGEIFADGRVGVVGGVAQKTVAAREAGAEVFIVPTDEVDTARAHADGLRIEPAGTLQDALRVLDSLGGNALSLGKPGVEDPG